MSFYLVELIWNDGLRTTFVVQADTREYALSVAEIKALNMWEGHIVSSRVEVIPIPGAPNLAEHVFTDGSGYHAPEMAERPPAGPGRGEG